MKIALFLALAGLLLLQGPTAVFARKARRQLNAQSPMVKGVGHGKTHDHHHRSTGNTRKKKRTKAETKTKTRTKTKTKTKKKEEEKGHLQRQHGADESAGSVTAGPCQAHPHCQEMMTECTAPPTSNPVLAGLDLVSAYDRTANLDNSSIPVFGTSDFTVTTKNDCKLTSVICENSQRVLQ